MIIPHSPKSLLVILLLCGLATSARAASFQGLGTLSNTPIFGSVASNISGDGSTVVGRSSPAGIDTPVQWALPSSTGPQILFGAPEFPLGDGNGAYGVSHDGKVIVGWDGIIIGDDEAWRWTSATGRVGLGLKPSKALDVNGDGSVVVGSASFLSGSQGFRWTSETGMVELGDLPGGLVRSGAYGVSDDGNVIVGYGTSVNGREAFRWTSATGMVGLGDLPGGTFGSVANNISADGTVIVGQANSANGTEAFRWTAAEGIVGLGDLTGGEFWSEALAISADGKIIVGQARSTNGDAAFIWDGTHGMRSLQTVLETQMGLSTDLAGSTLLDANGISADGLTIVGTMANDANRTEAYVVHLDPPNVAPSVDAGLPQTITQPNTALLDGTVSDDGLPNPPATVTTTWSKVGGPGTTTFTNPHVVDTTASFSLPGTYFLRLTADDGALTTSDEVTLTVNPMPPQNQSPFVNAGTDQTITLLFGAVLNGRVTDDGLPNPPGTVTTLWSKASGPGDVIFGDPNALDTTATFSRTGTFVLRLIATDGALSSHSDLIITVNNQDVRRQGHDLDGDGKADIVWRHTINSVVAVWLMNGTTIASAGFLGGVPPQWKIGGVGDVNGDGKADVIWQHSSGVVAVWLMNGLSISSVGFPGRVSSEWQLEGVGDANGDGKADVIWRNSRGVVAVWLMNGPTIASAGFFGGVSAHWQIEGVGDVNGDGKADVVWRNTSGGVAMWLLNGLRVTSVEFPGSAPHNWAINKVGDVDGDGKADIVWRNTSSNIIAIWLMNGKTIAASGFSGSMPSEWQIMQADDVNGDGKADVIWRNSLNGEVKVWIMNGWTITTTGSPGATSTDWEIQ